jgi:glycosyltransferase involved in cell wall biosynthesis
MHPVASSDRSATPRVLVLAEAANPEWASVPLVGWSHANALREVADVHLVTQIRNREAILRVGWREGRDFTGIDSERVVRPLHRLAGLLGGGAGRGWTTGTAIHSVGYPYFERLVWRRFRGRLLSGEFDIVHRVTPVSPTSPSPLAVACRRVGVPFVLGPINGGLPWPREFGGARRREREWLSYVRGAYRLMPAYRSTLASASAILVGSRATWRQLPRTAMNRCVYLPENAIDPKRFPEPLPRSHGPILRVVFVGRLVPYKGADMLLEAVEPLVREGRATLTIVGDGPERRPLEERIRAAGLGAGVTLVGWVEQDQVHRFLSTSDMMAFPSIREFGGGVVLEAMACGAVPLVVDYGGPAELVTPSTGFLVTLGSRGRVVREIRDVLLRVASNPNGLETRRVLGMRRVREVFSWNAKAAQVREVYRWVRGQRLTKPDFGTPLGTSSAGGTGSH